MISSRTMPWLVSTWVSTISSFAACVEAGPAAAAVKLCLRGKQFGPAADAAVHARLVMVPVFAGEGRLGSFLAGYVELIGRELGPPLVIGFGFGFCQAWCSSSMTIRKLQESTISPGSDMVSYEL